MFKTHSRRAVASAAAVAAAVSVLPSVALAQGAAPKPLPKGATTPGSATPPARPVPAPIKAAAPKPKPAPPAPKLPANVVARVDGTDITGDQIVATVRSWGGRPVVQQLIQGAAIEKEAKRLGVTVTDKEVAAEVEKQKQSAVSANKMTNPMMTWKEIAARDGVSEGFLAWNMRLLLLARKSFTKTIEKSAPSLDGQVKLAHILIPNFDPNQTDQSKPPTPEEEKKRDEDAKAKADQVLADIKAKKITFEDAAKQYSADKGPDGQGSAANGGALPYYGKGMLDPAFEAAGWALKTPGEMTEAPVKSRYGYHIIKLIQRGADAPAAEKAAYRKEIVDRQVNQPGALQQWLQALVAKSKVTYNLNAQIGGPSPAAAKTASAGAPAPVLTSKK
jgi:foldase protein PrsA